MLRAILPSQQIETTMRMSQLGRASGGGSETEQAHQGSDDDQRVSRV